MWPVIYDLEGLSAIHLLTVFTDLTEQVPTFGESPLPQSRTLPAASNLAQGCFWPTMLGGDPLFALNDMRFPETSRICEYDRVSIVVTPLNLVWW